MGQDLEEKTPGTPDNTFRWLLHANAAGPLHASTPRVISLGDGTDTPLAITQTELFVNGSAIPSRDLSTWGDDVKMFGREYVRTPFLKLKTFAALRVAMIGDSTTEGSALGEYPMDAPVPVFRRLLVNAFPSVEVINYGSAGKSAMDWVDGNTSLIHNVEKQISDGFDLAYIRWGLNGAVTDDEAEEDPEDFQDRLDEYIDSIDSGVLRIREELGGNNYVGIILMTPNPRNLTEKWHKALDFRLRDLARARKCGFIDTYGLWRDYADVDTWFVDVEPARIHPGRHWSYMLAHVMYDFAFQGILRDTFGNSPLSSAGASARQSMRQKSLSFVGLDATQGASLSEATEAPGTGDFTYHTILELSRYHQSGSGYSTGSTIGLGGPSGSLVFTVNGDASGNTARFLHYVAPASGGVVLSARQLPLNEPTQILIVRRQGVLSCYVNGEITYVGEDSRNGTAGWQYIGANGGPYNNPPSGWIARPFALNYAASRSEIARIFRDMGEWQADWEGGSYSPVPAGSFEVGKLYQIVSAGSTSFTSIGSVDNAPGRIFRATGAGSGTGSAYRTGALFYLDDPDRFDGAPIYDKSGNGHDIESLPGDVSFTVPAATSIEDATEANAHTILNEVMAQLRSKGILSTDSIV